MNIVVVWCPCHGRAGHGMARHGMATKDPGHNDGIDGRYFPDLGATFCMVLREAVWNAVVSGG